MNPIRRSLVLDTLLMFAATSLVTMLLMTLGGGAKEGLSRGLPPEVVARILPYLVPEMLRFVVPGCLLFAVCGVFGRMAANNEIVALKSLGINPLQVVWPVLLLAGALSIFTFGLYHVCAVWARPNLRRLVSESIDEIAYSFLRANRSFSSGGLSIVVKGVEQEQLLKPIVTFEAGDHAPPVTLIAEKAQLRSDSRAGTLRIECENGRLEVAGKGSLSFPDRLVRDVVLRDFGEISNDFQAPAALGVGELFVQVNKEKANIARLRQRLQTRPALEAGGLDALRQQWEYHRVRLFRLQAEVPRRLSNGLGCLCFALVGIPVAMQRRSADVMSIFFLCFLPILLVYYPLLVTGENLARQGVHPQYSVWLADGVLLIVGAALLWRSQRR